MVVKRQIASSSRLFLLLFAKHTTHKTNSTSSSSTERLNSFVAFADAKFRASSAFPAVFVSISADQSAPKWRWLNTHTHTVTSIFSGEKEILRKKRILLPVFNRENERRKRKGIFSTLFWHLEKLLNCLCHTTQTRTKTRSSSLSAAAAAKLPLAAAAPSIFSYCCTVFLTNSFSNHFFIFFLIPPFSKRQIRRRPPLYGEDLKQEPGGEVHRNLQRPGPEGRGARGGHYVLAAAPAPPSALRRF